jgi:hypothetical protein
MNQYEFVLGIILIVMVASVFKARMRHVRGSRSIGAETVRDSQETVRLREEVAMLKERLQVLERITVEKENSLAKEIESLRDR